MAAIVVQLSPEVARNFNPDHPLTSLPEPLLEKTKDLGLVLQAIHPRASDPQLMTYFTTEVADPARAMQIVDRLAGCQGVDAVYVKPMDELP